MESITKQEKIARLFIVSTPIGNLDDISKRGIDTLGSVEYILSEDSRITIKLLKAYNIEKKLIIYNEHSSQKDRDRILMDIKSGHNIALVCDSGTPLISDPGYKLVKDCLQNNINVIPIPGCSSILASLVISGMPSDQFSFLGFLDSKNKLKTLETLKYYTGSLIIFSTFNKLEKDLFIISEILGNRECCIAKELTKQFESTRLGTLIDIKKKLDFNYEKGEMVLIIKGYSNDDTINEEKYHHLILEELKKGTSIKEIAEIFSEQYKVRKKYIYNIALELKNSAFKPKRTDI